MFTNFLKLIINCFYFLIFFINRNISPTHPGMMPIGPMRGIPGPRMPLRAPIAARGDYGKFSINFSYNLG